MTALHVGVDLAQARDFTAIVVVERFDRMDGRSPQVTFEDNLRLLPHFVVVHAERIAPGTSYPEQVRQIGAMLDDPAMRGATLTFDYTGVGRAVGDLFRDAYREGRCGKHSPRAFTFTSSSKFELVSNLVAVAQSGRLEVAAGIANGDQLAHELKAFSLKVGDSGHVRYEARTEGDHDDLVCATMLAVHRPRRVEVARGIDLNGNVVYRS